MYASGNLWHDHLMYQPFSSLQTEKYHPRCTLKHFSKIRSIQWNASFKVVVTFNTLHIGWSPSVASSKWVSAALNGSASVWHCRMRSVLFAFTEATVQPFSGHTWSCARCEHFVYFHFQEISNLIFSHLSFWESICSPSVHLLDD